MATNQPTPAVPSAKIEPAPAPAQPGIPAAAGGCNCENVITPGQLFLSVVGGIILTLVFFAIIDAMEHSGANPPWSNSNVVAPAPSEIPESSFMRDFGYNKQGMKIGKYHPARKEK